VRQTLPIAPGPGAVPDAVLAAYADGNKVFARLFSRWMDSNGWSHPTVTRLAKAALGGKEGWLHSSQIASLRHGDTRNPGPRAFVAIERLNHYIWFYVNQKLLIPGTDNDADYKAATPITEGGQPPPLGWFVEVFCGYRQPQEFPMFMLTAMPTDKVESASRSLSRMIRSLMSQRNLDPLEDFNSILKYWITNDHLSLDRLRKVVMTTEPLTPEELEEELARLTVLLQKLGAPVGDEEELLSQLLR